MGMESLSTTLLVAATSQEHADNVNAMIIAGGGVVLSVFAAWVTAKLSIKADERRTIRESNMRLMEWAIEYPFLESTAYCDSWPNTNRDEEDNMRYDTFCCHVFNVLQHCWEFCKGDRSKMQHILYPDELIWLHRRWWQHDDVNQKAYPVGFRQFVAERIRVLSKESERGS